MKLRKDIVLEGIPFVWTTNLSDEDIREFYAIVGDDPDLDASGAKATRGASFTLRLYHKAIEFKEGYCLCHGMAKYLGVIYRTAKDWDLWHARRAEIDELREEQQSERVAEEALFKSQDDYMRQEINTHLSGGRYDQACELLDQRFAIRSTIEDERKRVGNLWQLRVEAIEMFSTFPTTDLLRSILWNSTVRFLTITCFSRNGTATRRKTSDEKKWIEIEKVFRAATARFPDDGLLVKHACLFWERQSQIRAGGPVLPTRD